MKTDSGRRTYLIRDVRADIFQPRVSTRSLEGRRILAHLRELVSRLLWEVYTVYDARPGFDKCKRHFKADAAVPARHKCDTVGERKLLLEQRRFRI